MGRRQQSSSCRTVRQSLEEYGRGLAGGLLFSLPLLYTMEMWWAGFSVSPRELLLYVGLTFLLLLGYNRYAGMRRDSSWVEVGIDSVEEMGIGLILAALVLYLFGQITADMPPSEVLGKIIVESMTVAVGISIGTAQLGGESSDTGTTGDPKTKNGEPPNHKAQVVLAFCGAVLFAANVAPTEEIQLIGIETTTVKLLGIVALSLATSAITLFYSDFVGSHRVVRRDGLFWFVGDTAMSYTVALTAATLMLWFFHGLVDVSFRTAVSQIVVLAFPASLGASAGRLLIQSRAGG